MSVGPTRFAPGNGRARGQTSLDFLIGIGVFLATVGFVALFATDAVTPFADDQSGALVVERTADELVGVAFAGSRSASVLNVTCTRAFFDNASVPGCPTQPAPLAEQAGIPDTWDLNVTVERNDPTAAREIMCLDATDALQSCTGGGGETRLAAGDRPDFGSDAIVTTVRVVVLDGRDVAVVVRLW